MCQMGIMRPKDINTSWSKAKGVVKISILLKLPLGPENIKIFMSTAFGYYKYTELMRFYTTQTYQIIYGKPGWRACFKTASSSNPCLESYLQIHKLFVS